MSGLLKKYDEETLEKNFDQSLKSGRYSSGSGRIAKYTDNTVQIFDIKSRRIVYWNSYANVSLNDGFLIV